jgi:2-dehydropantoate 2-reductase
VANEAMALRRFANVYGVCVMFPATHLQPGVVVGHSAPVAGLLDVGRYPTGADPVAAQLAAAFGEARVGSLVRTDIMRWKYAKLLINLGNAIQALCGSGEETDVLAAMAREEGRGVLAAAGIPYASAQEDAARRGNHITYAPAGGQQRTGGSSWQSLARAAGAVEADYLNGEVVLLGRVHGVATPVNELARQLVNRWATQRRPPGSLTVAQFRALLVDA